MAVKRIVPIIAGLSLVTALTAKADSPVFGNSPGNGGALSLAFESGNTWGGAVLFTPTESITLSSVTLWLSGYNGRNGITPSVGIFDSSQIPGMFELGSEVVSLNTPRANNGTTGAFNFSDPGKTVLQAHQDYWLLAYGAWNSSASGSGGIVNWNAGSTPMGNAVFDQADSFVNGSVSQTPFLPAFCINSDSSPVVNAAPEPGTMALLTIPFLFGIGRIVYSRANSKKLAPVRVRRPAKLIRRNRKNLIADV